MRILLFTLVYMCIALVQKVDGQGCKQDSTRNGLNFTRVFIVVYDGIITNPGTDGTRVAASLGSCLTPETHVENIIQFFQSRGFDLSFLRQDPFIRHETNDFIVDPYSEGKVGGHRIITGSIYYDHVKYMNILGRYASWAVTAKRDLTWQGGSFSNGSWVFYGVVRWPIEGEDFCVEYYHTHPVVPYLDNTGLAPIDLVAKNQEWGTGYFRGLGMSKPDKSYHMEYSIIFTAPKP